MRISILLLGTALILPACGGSGEPSTVSRTTAAKAPISPAARCAATWNSAAPQRWRDELRGISAGFGPTDALVLVWHGKPLSVGTVTSSQDNHFTGHGTIKQGACTIAFPNQGTVEAVIFADRSAWMEAGPDRLPKRLSAPLYALGHRPPNATIAVDGRLKLNS